MNKIWDEFYKMRGRFYLLPHPNFNKVIQKFKRNKVHTVLDLGCGSGRHSIELAKNGFKVTGMDFSKEALSLAKQWAKRVNLKVNFLEGDIHKRLPFKKETFNGALAIDSICYESSESMESTLAEIRRVLVPGGIIFITLPTQVGNPLVTHMIFTREEIKDITGKHFKIIETFIDKGKYFCVFAIKEK